MEEEIEIRVPDSLALDSIREVQDSNGYQSPQRVYEDIGFGTMTRPIKFGRSSRWPRHEHQALAAAKIAGADSDYLRRLVAQLHAFRKKLLPRIRDAA